MRTALQLPPALRHEIGLAALLDGCSMEAVDATTFDAAYDALDAYFGPKGELEPRETLRAALLEPRWRGDIAVVFEMYRLHGPDGLVGVYDGRFVIGPDFVLGYGDHGLILPALRGQGLGRALDLADKRPLADRAARSVGRPAGLPYLVVADVDPLDPADPDSVRRIRVWAKANWAIVPPSRVPHALRGQQDPDRPGEILEGVANFLMIRSEDGSRPARLALPDAERLIRLVGAAPMAPEAHLAAWEATALAALHGESGDVEAWALPHPGDGWEAHARLLPSALRPWVPARWWHRPEPDAEADRAGLDRLLASGR